MVFAVVSPPHVVGGRRVYEDDVGREPQHDLSLVLLDAPDEMASWMTTAANLSAGAGACDNGGRRALGLWRDKVGDAGLCSGVGAATVARSERGIASCGVE